MSASRRLPRRQQDEAVGHGQRLAQVVVTISTVMRRRKVVARTRRAAQRRPARRE
jgi:hypothetical protein